MSYDEALMIAAKLREAAKTLIAMIDRHRDTLSLKDIDSLQQCEAQLRSSAEELVTQATDIVLNEGAVNVNDLTGVAQQSANVLQKINDVKRSIFIATALISMTNAIVKADAGGISSAYHGLKQTIS